MARILKQPASSTGHLTSPYSNQGSTTPHGNTSTWRPKKPCKPHSTCARRPCSPCIGANSYCPCTTGTSPSLGSPPPPAATSKPSSPQLWANRCRCQVRIPPIHGGRPFNSSPPNRHRASSEAALMRRIPPLWRFFLCGFMGLAVLFIGTTALFLTCRGQF